MTTEQFIPVEFELTSDIRYGYEAFIAELKVLEKNYNKKEVTLFSKPDLLTQYSNLLNRVQNYATANQKYIENKKITTLDNKDIAILNYVHSALLSRINQLTSSDSFDLVINILG